MTVGAVDDLRSDDQTPPTGDQTFLVEAVVSAAGSTRRAVARGRDIYAITAPLVVEAAGRILAMPDRPAGVMAPGELFDARDFLTTLKLLN